MKTTFSTNLGFSITNNQVEDERIYCNNSAIYVIQIWPKKLN